MGPGLRLVRIVSISSDRLHWRSWQRRFLMDHGYVGAWQGSGCGCESAQLSWDLINPDGWLAGPSCAIGGGVRRDAGFDVLYDKVEAREGSAGRPAADPAVLFALWLLGAIYRVGSARELTGLPARIWPIAGSRAACRSTTTDLRSSGWRMPKRSTICSPRRWQRSCRRDCLTQMRSSSMHQNQGFCGKSSYKRALRLDEAEAAARRVSPP